MLLSYCRSPSFSPTRQFLLTIHHYNLTIMEITRLSCSTLVADSSPVSPVSTIIDLYITDDPCGPLDEKPSEEEPLSKLKERADAHFNNGDYEASKSLYASLVQRVQQTEQPCSQLTVDAREDLAIAYVYTGNYQEAEMLFKEILREQERFSGLMTDQFSLHKANHNMGNILCDLNRHELAEDYYQKALRWRLKTLGSDNCYTLITLMQLAMVRTKLARYQEAETLLLKVIRGYPEWASLSTHVVGARHCLAITLGTQPSRLREAEILFKRVWAETATIYGEKHPCSLAVAHDLAYCQYRQGRYTESVSVGRLALDGRIAKLGQDHPRTKESATNLYLSLKAQRRESECCQLRLRFSIQ